MGDKRPVIAPYRVSGGLTVFGFATHILKSFIIFGCLVGDISASYASPKSVITQWSDIQISTEFNEKLKLKKHSIIYFRTTGDVDPHARDSEYQNTTLRQKLAGALNLTANSKEASYLLQVRAEVATTFALRNAEGSPSRAYVMFSLCHVTITNVKTDCQNTAFHSFKQINRDDLFDAAFALWLNRVSSE